MFLGISKGRPTTKKSFELIVKNFIVFAKQKLNIKIDVPVELIYDLQFSMKYSSFACIMSDSKQIYVSVVNRHPVDILRSLAHEMVHYRQMLDGQNILGYTGSRHENEANAKAGIVLRDYGKIHPELFLMKPIQGI
tara:strand:- start:3179 stop:3586 length:408 start_codon:yes stop_codon:yes gene_type:complete